MARAHFVKKAYKDNPVAKKGESYYWWEFRFGGKHFSKTPPSRGQLTQSEFLSAYYDLADNLDNEVNAAETFEDLQNAVENAIGDIESLASEQEEKLYNMPEQLQDSDSGQLLQQRQSDLESWASELQSTDFECSMAEPTEPGEGATEEDQEAYQDELTEYHETYESELDQAKESVRNADPGIN